MPVQAGAAPVPDDDGETHGGGHGIHLPGPSFWPLFTSFALPTIAYGVLYSWWLVGAGAAVLLIGFTGWALEPSVAE